MRNYKNVDLYLNKLTGDVYPQPEDEGHTGLAHKVIDHWMSRLSGVETVLDLGCGTGFCQQWFEEIWNVTYRGIALGEDYIVAKDLDRKVSKMDFSFLEYGDESFDLLFSRHSLEHSPFPLLTLMEWHRVSKSFLGLVLPTPDWYGYGGRNHYYVLNKEQWMNVLDNAGWHVIWDEIDSLPFDKSIPEETKPHEYWLFAEKK